LDHAVGGFAEPILAGEINAPRGANNSGSRHDAVSLFSEDKWKRDDVFEKGREYQKNNTRENKHEKQAYKKHLKFKTYQ
jgi:hypothetical protein